MNFHDLGLSKAILRTLEEIGHTEPTPIQAQAIPAVLDGKDVVGLAQTGTGKTAAFLLPLLQNTDDPGFRAKYRPIKVLILSPTRELAAQIFEKARQYGKSLNLKSQCTVGGVPINKQINYMSRGTDILVATPGRLLDLTKRKSFNLDHVEALVLDEADHMFDIGFFPDVKRIIAQLPEKRQTLLFSATMPKAIQELAEQYLTDPVEVSVARQSSVADKIDQSVIHISGRQKTDRLASIINEHHGKRVVVFARTKHGSDKIVKRLEVLGIDAKAIHGNKSQGQRERALKAFTRGDCNVLIATDIAARGIDIKDVTMVVNYELPDVPEVYIHRIGRTARAGAEGIAIAFCAPDETKKLRAIEKLIKQTLPFEGEVVEQAGDTKKKPQRNARNRPGSRARKKPGFKPGDGKKADHKPGGKKQNFGNDAKQDKTDGSGASPEKHEQGAKPDRNKRRGPKPGGQKADGQNTSAAKSGVAKKPRWRGKPKPNRNRASQGR